MKALQVNAINGHKPLPDGIYIDKSDIHGMGLFTNKKLESGYDFGITHVEDNRFPNGFIRTPFGGFINHSFSPNCELYEDGDTLHIKTVKEIEVGQELTIDYRPWYNDKELSSFK